MQHISRNKNMRQLDDFFPQNGKAAKKAKFTCIINVFVILTNYIAMHLFFSQSDSNILASKDGS